jgi:hypothetical protein
MRVAEHRPLASFVTRKNGSRGNEAITCPLIQPVARSMNCIWSSAACRIRGWLSVHVRPESSLVSTIDASVAESVCRFPARFIRAPSTSNPLNSRYTGHGESAVQLMPRVWISSSVQATGTCNGLPSYTNATGAAGAAGATGGSVWAAAEKTSSRNATS